MFIQKNIGKPCLYCRGLLLALWCLVYLLGLPSNLICTFRQTGFLIDLGSRGMCRFRIRCLSIRTPRGPACTLCLALGGRRGQAWSRRSRVLRSQRQRLACPTLGKYTVLVCIFFPIIVGLRIHPFAWPLSLHGLFECQHFAAIQIFMVRLRWKEGWRW